MLELVGQFLALAGVLVGMLEAQAESDWEALVGIPAPTQSSTGEFRLHRTGRLRASPAGDPTTSPAPVPVLDHCHGEKAYFSICSCQVPLQCRKGGGMRAGWEVRCSPLPVTPLSSVCASSRLGLGLLHPCACSLPVPKRSCVGNRGQRGIQEASIDLHFLTAPKLFLAVP